MLCGKPWKLEAVLFFWIGVLICLCFGTVGTLELKALRPGLNLPDRMFFEFLIGAAGLQFIPLILTHIFIRQQNVTWGEFLGWSRRPLGIPLGRAILVAVAMVPMALILNEAAAQLITSLQAKPPEQQPTMQVLEISQTWGRRVLFTLAAVVLAPITEEILFRGVLYASIKEMGYPRAALFGTAILFAAIHGSWMTLLPLTFFALVQTLLYERTGRLLAPILSHAIFNVTNIAFYFLQHASSAVPK